MQLKYCILIIWTVQLLYTILYRSHCFCKQFMITITQTKISPQTCYYITHLKWYNIEKRDGVNDTYRDECLCVNNQIAEQELRRWLSDGDSHHLIVCYSRSSDFFFILIWSNTGTGTLQYVSVGNHNATYNCILRCWGSFSILEIKQEVDAESDHCDQKAQTDMQ